MMMYATLNWHDYGDYMKINAPCSNVNSTDKEKSKRIIAHDTLFQNFSTDEIESKCSIVNENLSQSCSMNEG